MNPNLFMQVSYAGIRLNKQIQNREGAMEVVDQVILQVTNVSNSCEILEFYLSFYQDNDTKPTKHPKIKKWSD